MADRRRVNGPPGGTVPPVYISNLTAGNEPMRGRTRAPGEMRKIFLKTGLTPSASGSAYLELEASSNSTATPMSLKDPRSAGLKLACAVHGPRPLSRSAPFTPQLLLSTRIKFAPFAARQRRGFVPDPNERDLAAHLETALRGILIGERWPKSGVDVVITVLEGEEDFETEDPTGQMGGWGMMSILSGCITVASAAIVDAGIDCIDLITGGVAAVVRQPMGASQLVLDPSPSDHREIEAACVIAYLQSRDEITEIWAKGSIDGIPNGIGSEKVGFENLVDMAGEAAMAARLVLIEAVNDSTEAKLQRSQLGQQEVLEAT